jgi:hypothetical protein
LEEINEYFKDKYDLFYLPIDYANNCNLGFAFINFIDPMHVIAFYDKYRGKKWKKFNSEKVKLINKFILRYVNWLFLNFKEKNN